MTRPEFGSWLRQVHQSQLENRLSQPALETLAIVAYRQPVLRAAIEAIRGVQCGEMLRQLMERDLVRIVGRSQELGRPYLFGTTKRFLQLFGLRHLDELPRAQQLRGSIDAAPPPAATEATKGLFSSAVRQEESDVKTTVETELQPLSAGPAGAGVLELESRANPFVAASHERAMDEEDDLDDEEEDEEDEEEDSDDDEDIEDSDWEEVDDDEDEEEEEDEDEDWDDEDEDWDEEDDEDWEDDDEEEDDEEEEEADDE